MNAFLFHITKHFSMPNGPIIIPIAQVTQIAKPVPTAMPHRFEELNTYRSAIHDSFQRCLTPQPNRKDMSAGYQQGSSKKYAEDKTQACGAAAKNRNHSKYFLQRRQRTMYANENSYQEIQKSLNISQFPLRDPLRDGYSSHNPLVTQVAAKDNANNNRNRSFIALSRDRSQGVLQGKNINENVSDLNNGLKTPVSVNKKNPTQKYFPTFLKNRKAERPNQGLENDTAEPKQLFKNCLELQLSVQKSEMTENQQKVRDNVTQSTISSFQYIKTDDKAPKKKNILPPRNYKPSNIERRPSYGALSFDGIIPAQLQSSEETHYRRESMGPCLPQEKNHHQFQVDKKQGYNLQAAIAGSRRRLRDNSQVKTNHRFKIEDFLQIRQLSIPREGTQVRLCIHRTSGFLCALKIIDRASLEPHKNIHTIVNEIKVQLYLNHPNLVKLYGCFSDSQRLYLILEPCLGGHLKKEITSLGGFSEEDTLQLLSVLFEAVSFMHSHHIIHRDLKPENIILHEGVVKICDFGWAVHSSGSYNNTFCGTPLYIAPEVLTGDNYDYHCDIWCLGITAFEALYNRVPFNIWTEKDLQNIVMQRIYFPVSRHISREMQTLIATMLSKKASMRGCLNSLLTSGPIAVYIEQKKNKPLDKDTQLLSQDLAQLFARKMFTI